MPHRITQCYLPPGRGDIPALTPAEAGTRLSDPGGMQGWVDLGRRTSKCVLTTRSCCRCRDISAGVKTTPFSAFCTAIHSFVTGEPRDFKFGTSTYHGKSHPADEKSSLKGALSGSAYPFLNFTPPHVKSPLRLMLETSNFVHGSAMRSLSLVMSECYLSWSGSREQ